MAPRGLAILLSNTSVDVSLSPCDLIHGAALGWVPCSTGAIGPRNSSNSQIQPSTWGQASEARASTSVCASSSAEMSPLHPVGPPLGP
eukprot:3777641-Amphidinium_carterae.2